MHQQSAPPHYSSAQTGGQPYQGQQVMGVMGQLTQGNSVMSQRSMGSYRSSQQGTGTTHVKVQLPQKIFDVIHKYTVSLTAQSSI